MMQGLGLPYTRNAIMELAGIHPIISAALGVRRVTEQSSSKAWEDVLLIMVIELVKSNENLLQRNQELLRGHYAPPIQVELNDLTKDEAVKILQQIAGQVEWLPNEESNK